MYIVTSPLVCNGSKYFSINIIVRGHRKGTYRVLTTNMRYIYKHVTICLLLKLHSKNHYFSTIIIQTLAVYIIGNTLINEKLPLSKHRRRSHCSAHNFNKHLSAHKILCVKI